MALHREMGSTKPWKNSEFLGASPGARREPGEMLWNGSCRSAGAARQKDEEQGAEKQPSHSTPRHTTPHPVCPEGQMTREGQELLPCTSCWRIQDTIPAGQPPVESAGEGAVVHTQWVGVWCLGDV